MSQTTPAFGSRFERIVLVLIAAASLYQLVLPPSIGLADNGDFPRIISRFHLDHVPSSYEDQYFYFFNAKYRFNPEQQWRSGFVSSTTLLVMLAIPISRLVFTDGLFDLRVLGLLYLALVLTAVWLLLVWSRRLSPPERFVCGAMLVLTLSDVGYVAYFNSFYSEPTGLVFLLLALAFVLLAMEEQRPRPAYLALYFAAAGLFVAAKPQYAPGGVLLAAFGARLWSFHADGWWRRICVSGAFGLLLCSFATYRLSPAIISNATYYVAVFSELLKHSPDPRADLVELGLPPDLAQYAGTNPYQPGAPTADPAFQQAFFDRISFGRLAGFYLRHPGRLAASLDRSAAFALLLRPQSLGNFEKSAGLVGGTRSEAFSHWTGIHRLAAPGRLWSLGLFFGGTLGAAVWLHRKAGRRRRLEVELYGVLAVLALSQFVMVSILQGTIDTMKHMFLVSLLFDLCLATSLIHLAGRWGRFPWRVK